MRKKNSIKNLNINKKLLLIYEKDGIITFFLLRAPNRRCIAYQAWGFKLVTSSLWFQACGLRTFYRAGREKIIFKCIGRFQFFSHTSAGVSKKNLKLNPWFISGFSDGEGCFHVSITKNKKFKVGWEVRLSFKIELHCRDEDLLKQIQTSLSGVGSISKRGQRKSICFSVQSVIDMKIIINHFDKYPLITEGGSDFKLFKQVFHLMELKKHLTLDGFQKILLIRASMNKGLSEVVKKAFPNIIPAERSLV